MSGRFIAARGIRETYALLVVGIEIRHLRVVLAVHDSGSMNAAAQALGVSQPSVSRAVRELESHLHATLILRGTRGATMAPASRDFIASARRAVEAFDHALTTPATAPALRIAYAWSALIPAMERILRSWNDDSPHPGIELTRAANPIAAVTSAAADLALVRDWKPRPGLSHLDIDHEPRAVVVSASHKLSGHRTLTLADLRDYGLVINTQSGTTPTDLWGHAHNAALDRTTTDVEDWLTVIATTPTVFGITPSSTADLYQHPSITYIPLRGAPGITSTLVWNEHHPSIDTFVAHAYRATTVRQRRSCAKRFESSHRWADGTQANR